MGGGRTFLAGLRMQCLASLLLVRPGGLSSIKAVDHRPAACNAHHNDSYALLQARLSGWSWT